MSKEISVFSGINSIGIPYTNDNVNHIGYFEIICENLNNDGYKVNGINLSNIARNRTFDLEEIFNKNEKYSQIRKNQYIALKLVRENNKYIGQLIPEKFLNKYAIPDNLDDENITDLYVNSKNPIFLYSGGENDFMTYIGTGPMELVHKEVRDKLPTNLLELLIKSVDCVEQNWKFLINLNPTVQIYAYNVFYAPLYDSIQQEIFKQKKEINPNIKYKNTFEQCIQLFNRELLNRSKKYDNVEIIDIEFIKDYVANGDFHQNYLGNKLIAEKTMQYILENKRLYDEQAKSK